MLSSISPVGEASRRQRWWVTAIAHLVGSAAGGAAVGALLGGVGALVARPFGGVSTQVGLLVLATAATVGLLVDLGPGSHRLPSWRRQVDERWLGTYRGWVYGAGYGLQLGAGAVTIVPATTTYVAGLAAALTGTWALGAVVGVVFGTVRALPLLLTARIRTVDALARLMRGMAGARRRAEVLTGAGQGATAALALALVVTT